MHPRRYRKGPDGEEHPNLTLLLSGYVSRDTVAAARDNTGRMYAGHQLPLVEAAREGDNPTDARSLSPQREPQAKREMARPVVQRYDTL